MYKRQGGCRIKAAIYCRLSKEDAAKTGPESESIQNQRSMLLRYAAEHGYTVQEVYIDEDYSGADRRRPAFNQMLAAAERREFDVILAKTQSRFTRDMELVEKYLHGKFAEWGIRFIAVVDHCLLYTSLDACSFELVRGYVFAGISAFLFGQTPPRCIGGTTLRRVTKPCCAYKKGSIYDENSIDHCWQ